MSLHGELAGGAAQRRRERRLRSWLRHERQTVAMVLAEVCHHSSGSFPPTLKERRMAGQVAYEALRGQRTARTAGLQGRLVAHSRPGCGGAPSPSLPHLAGGDTLDDTSVHFLLEMALLSPEEVEQLRQAERRKLAREEKEKEEKKKKEKERQEFFARWTAEYLNSLSQSSSSTADSFLLMPSAPWTSALARSVQLRRELQELRGEKRGRRGRSGKRSFRRLPQVMDVPVIIIVEFQQSIPQIQFIHTRLVFQLWRRDKYPQCMLYSSRCRSWTRFLACPVCCFDKCLVRWCRKLWSFRNCSSSLFVDIPFVPQMLIPTVQTILQIIEIPHLLFVFGCRCPCFAGRAVY